MVDFDYFSKLDLKIGKIMEVRPHPDAEKLFLLSVDIGEKVVQLVAGIKPFYTLDELMGKLVVVLVNLKPKNIRGVMSEGMLLAAQGREDVSLIVADKQLDVGSVIG